MESSSCQSHFNFVGHQYPSNQWWILSPYFPLGRTLIFSIMDVALILQIGFPGEDKAILSIFWPRSAVYINLFKTIISHTINLQFLLLKKDVVVTPSLSIPLPYLALPLCSHDEAVKLIQFKHSFAIDKTSSADCDNFGNKSYPKTDSWKEDTDCCSWDGVTCDNIKGRVIGLDLNCSWLYGTIPSNSSLFHLPHLQKLNLAFNDFNSSKMSSKFGGFASLMYLNLSGSNFAGQVSSQVSHLSKLLSLDLSRNYGQTLQQHVLEGLVHNLTEVRDLFLDGTDMSSINPNVLRNLSSSLRSLSLYMCGLGGKFPENVFHLPNLKLLNLGDNGNLSLNLPQFNRSSHLKLLDLSAMSFSRELFESIGNLVSLERLDVSNAFFSGGGLPNSIGNLISLKDLELSNCNLSGSIPISLGNLSQLSYLYLSRNFFSGSIPSSLTNLKQLEFFTIFENMLEGSIPDEVNAFPNLISLGLSSNLLGGTLPSWLYSISSLKYIYLSHNQFSGHIKEFQYNSLEVIMLDNNKLQGPIPSSLSQLVNLADLSLSSNNLSGIVEFSMFSKLQNLGVLDLSSSHLSLNSNGTSAVYTLPNLRYLSLPSCNVSKFPQFLRGSKSLLYLDLSNNSLSGKVSSLICNMTSLRFLDLSHNNLSGIIPKCLGNLSESLRMLNLQMNKFHGIIPPTFTKGCQLKNLNLNGNQLEGPLTRSILNCRGLEVLDLGDNRINDTFPHWLGSLPELQVLVLRSNQLQGSIQDNRSNLSFSKIQIFDISSNSFSGVLPVRYLKNFKAMINLTENESATRYMGVKDGTVGTFYSYSIEIAIKGVKMEVVKIFIKLTSIDLSNNKFQGEIPKAIGNLNSLKGLNLSRNNLSGCIPTSIGNLISLEWLDLSSNKLVGTIPEKLLDLTSLSIFNVSENHLQGQIPQGKQFNTFGNDSYEGNRGLCGFPVSKGCGNSELPPSNLLEEDGSKSNIAFGWKAVLTGYGCGVVFGLVMGYFVFQTGKPKWIVALVEDRHHMRRKRSKIGNRNGGGRRT
ncbi:receptor-like protein 12 [Durio zibethinus]|uniref:Receptor-like protein 12 n=1 Tax=Durio zibethinus TaxID=66656 RepID=A0A6P5Y4Z6_DURZI|nr:receptor-like protein 12 [Durio zibethinus]